MLLSRRSFVRASTSSLLALSAATYAGAANQPNDRLRVAVMGVHGRGRQLATGFAQQPNCEVVALCEVDDAAISPVMKDLDERSTSAPKWDKDIRKLLEWKNVDALVVATPDHWHALATVWACQHGKHVYVEKPVSHNAIEGQRMVELARKHDRVVQYGCQRRSANHVQSAIEFLRAGGLGKVPFARSWIAGDRKSIGKKADGPIPKGVDYDLWLGPAPERPFNPNRFHYNWHWNWDYGTGELGNNGIHGLDICRWGLGVDFPTRITCGGGKFYYDDDQQTPDTQIATFDFPTCSITWEHRIWSKTGLMGESWGVAFYGEKGTLVFDKNGWHVEQGVEASEKPTGNMDAAHLQNFIDAIRTGKKPHAEIHDGHKSTLLCHLGNIAYRTGRTLRFDGMTQKILDDREACQLLGRSYRPGFELPAQSLETECNFVFDTDSCRRQFPALRRELNGQPVVYFDGPAGSQTPQRVVDAISKYMLDNNANHGGVFASSRASDALLHEAHRAVADLIGSDDPDTVIFGANMTTLTFGLSRALGRTWKTGDEVLVTRLDHDANVTPWVLAARDAGATVRHVGITPECTLDLDDFHRQLSRKTRLVAVGCASNAVGTINPLQPIIKAAHEVGALVFLDAVHYAPHRVMDVTGWGCDFLACSAYKFFGPHVGVLWGKRPLLEALPAYKLRPVPDDLPGRWMTGTQSHEGIAGALAAVEYLAELGGPASPADRRAALLNCFAALTTYETALARQLLEGLTKLPDVRVWGITDLSRLNQRVPTFSITHRRIKPVELARYLDAHGIYVWNGNYYALELTETLGLEPDGMVRIGLLHYNTAAEVERLLTALQCV